MMPTKLLRTNDTDDPKRHLQAFFSGSVARRSLRIWLVLVLGLALLPVALLGTYNTSILWVHKAEIRQQQFATLMKEHREDRATALERLNLVIRYFEQIPEDIANDNCAQLLKAMTISLETITDIAVVSRDGLYVCSTNPDAVGQSVRNENWFAQYLAMDAPLLVSEETDAAPSLTAVHYLRPIQSGPFAGRIMDIAFPQQLLNQIYADIEAAEARNNATYHLINADGALIDRHRNEESAETYRRALPHIVDRIEFLETSAQPIAFLETDELNDGQLGAVMEILPGTVYFVGFTQSQLATRFSDERFLTQLLIPLAMWILAIAATWLVADRMILRWLRRLQWQANWYTAGRFDRSVNMSSAPSEFQQVRNTFMTMANTIIEKRSALQTALADKEILVKEIHHRVKNNLQIVTSLLNLQASRIVDQDSQRSLFEAQSRINALAGIHQSLYEIEDVTHVKLNAFMHRLQGQFKPLLDTEHHQIKVVLSVPEMTIAADKAIPLALLTAEAIMNSVKHGFSGVRHNGTIWITIRRSENHDDRHDLVIRDDGQGKSVRNDAQNTENVAHASLGTMLIESFCRQLGGTLEEHAGPSGFEIRLMGMNLLGPT